MAVDMFIKIGDIKGEAQDSAFKEQIDVLAWSWGISQSGSMHTGGGGGSGKANFQDLSFTKWVDKSTPVLMLACANGAQYGEAEMVCRKAGKAALTYITMKFKDVIITSVSTGGSGGEDRLTENVTINFRKVGYNYQPQKQDGSKDGGEIKFGWEIAENISTSM